MLPRMVPPVRTEVPRRRMMIYSLSYVYSYYYHTIFSLVSFFRIVMTMCQRSERETADKKRRKRRRMRKSEYLHSIIDWWLIPYFNIIVVVMMKCPISKMTMMMKMRMIRIRRATMNLWWGRDLLILVDEITVDHVKDDDIWIHYTLWDG